MSISFHAEGHIARHMTERTRRTVVNRQQAEALCHRLRYRGQPAGLIISNRGYYVWTIRHGRLREIRPRRKLMDWNDDDRRVDIKNIPWHEAFLWVAVILLLGLTIAAAVSTFAQGG